jgi:hypothetical protein
VAAQADKPISCWPFFLPRFQAMPSTGLMYIFLDDEDEAK